MLHWSLGLVAVLIPIQLFFGHLTGLYVLKHQPAKFAAIEARWKNQQPASEVLIAIPDPVSERNLFAIEIPRLGSMIASGNWTAPEVGLESFPPKDRPSVIIPFFAFRIMVGMGLIMLAVSWLGNLLRFRAGLRQRAGFCGAPFLSFPTGFIAVLAGWYTAEVGRQPWVVYGLLRTADAVTPSLTTIRCCSHLPLCAGIRGLHRGSGHTTSSNCFWQGPTVEATAIPGATARRPMAFADDAASATGNQPQAGE
jgi:Cytochrome bd-type quinol oxidase, subunit 1